MTRNDLVTLSQRLREYKDNPHHINPMSESFDRLIIDAADALSEVAEDYDAQHSRIVAAKDAEIARLEAERARWEGIAQKLWDKGDERFAAEIYQALDDAQPVRQVPVHGLADAPNQVEAAIVAIRELWDEDECPPYPVVAKALRRLLPPQPARQVSCVACEDNPSGENAPCAVCGKPARQVGEPERLAQLESAVREFAGFFSSDDARHWQLLGLADNRNYDNAQEGGSHE